MGVRSICTFGYPVSTCRCAATHDPVKVAPCSHLTIGEVLTVDKPPQHPGRRYERADEAFRAAGMAALVNNPTLAGKVSVSMEKMNLTPVMKRCDRCGDEHGEKDFRGSVCGWCADDLEKADEHLPRT